MRIERGEHMSYSPKFENIVEACLRAMHWQAWQLARKLTRKVNKRKE
jgi:hypothetical protein